MSQEAIDALLARDEQESRELIEERAAGVR